MTALTHSAASSFSSTPGLERMRAILGEKADLILENFNTISPDFASYIENFAYGTLYQRPGLEDKIREVAAVSCLIGQGITGLALESHLRGMLNVGWKKEEVLELLLFLIGYKGFPPVVEAMLTFQKIMNKKS